MNISIVIYIQSYLILFIGLLQVFPLGFAFYYYLKKIEPNVNDINTVVAFVISIVLTLFVGAILNLITKRYRRIEVKVRESFAIVTFGWVFAALFATIPFLIHSYLVKDMPGIVSISSFTNAYFEMMSGFTTTGSSILTNIEAIPKGLLFWRSLTHWLGGMGIILLAVAILPALGVGGMQLYQAETPGPLSDKIAPRISQTAKLLWGVYLIFTVVQTVLLMIGGMDLFDALCHSFGTVATGGFSTKNQSIGHYNSAYIDCVIIVFMFLAGASFSLHYRFLSGKFKAHIKDKEFLFYTSIITIATALIILDTNLSNRVKEFSGSWLESARLVLFQVVSTVTTTGYGVGFGKESLFHFGLWSSFSQFLIIMLMFKGGSAGSTAGGVKSLRVYLMLKFAYNEIIKFIYPRHIKLIRIGNKVIPEAIILSTVGFIIIHFFIMGIGTLIMNFLEGDFVTSYSSVVSALNNIGPGLGPIGPDKNYAHISNAGKWVLSFLMLLGRLELYSVIILFFPTAWKKN